MTLGQKIKQLRIKNGLTQKGLAEQVHVTFQTVSKWEKDENEPDVSTLRELAKLFGCSMDYLLSEDEQIEVEIQEEEVSEPVVESKTVIVPPLHVCERCKKEIPPDELVVQRVEHKIGDEKAFKDVYYHKACLEEVAKEKNVLKIRAAKKVTSKRKKLAFGLGIGIGAALQIAGLILLLVFAQEYIHPAASVGISFGIAYVSFAMVYCVVTGSYISDVLLWGLTFTVKFPGLIFEFSIDGFAWLIAMKILFAIVGFLIGVAVASFCIGLSLLLSAVSFPFILIYNEKTGYGDSLIGG